MDNQLFKVLAKLRGLNPKWEVRLGNKIGDSYIATEARFAQVTPDGELKGMVFHHSSNTGADGFLVQVYLEVVKTPARVQRIPDKQGNIKESHYPEQREIIMVYRGEHFEFAEEQRVKFTLLREKLKTRIQRVYPPEYPIVKQFFDEVTAAAIAAERAKKEKEKSDREQLTERLKQNFFS